MLINGLSQEEIAKKYNTSVYNLNQVIHRNRLFNSEDKTPSLTYRIIAKIFRNYPQYFRPTREFYHSVNISQQRWWALYRGDSDLTDDEYQSIISHFKMTYDEVLELGYIPRKKDPQTNFLATLDNNK